MPILETARVLLRQLTPDDQSTLETLFADPEVMKFSEGLRSREQVQAWLKQMIEIHYPTWGFGKWAMVDKADGAMIGYCGFTQYDDHVKPGEGEIGYRLMRPGWGRGLATESAMAACDYGFSALDFDRILAFIDPRNTGSIDVAKKIGMIFEREELFAGYDHPDHVYVLGQSGR